MELCALEQFSRASFGQAWRAPRAGIAALKFVANVPRPVCPGFMADKTVLPGGPII